MFHLRNFNRIQTLHNCPINNFTNTALELKTKNTIMKHKSQQSVLHIMYKQMFFITWLKWKSATANTTTKWFFPSVNAQMSFQIRFVIVGSRTMWTPVWTFLGMSKFMCFQTWSISSFKRTQFAAVSSGSACNIIKITIFLALNYLIILRIL